VLSPVTGLFATVAGGSLHRLNTSELVLAPETAPLARVVASVFDTYLRSSAVRHSVAV
jgi:hypothetical protein